MALVKELKSLFRNSKDLITETAKLTTIAVAATTGVVEGINEHIGKDADEVKETCKSKTQESLTYINDKSKELFSDLLGEKEPEKKKNK